MAIYGVDLPEMQLRHWLGDRVEQAHDEYYYSYGVRPEMVERADAIANSIANLVQIALLEPSNYGEDYYNRCDTYVFSRILGEVWHNPRSFSGDSTDLWFNSLPFLVEKGFVPLSEEGEPGDVVMYVTKHELNAQHFGIYRGGGMVDSKFAMGPLLRHPIDMVPVSFGDKYIFLRKVADSLDGLISTLE